MSESMNNPLNDFLEMEESSNGMFEDNPFVSQAMPQTVPQPDSTHMQPQFAPAQSLAPSIPFDAATAQIYAPAAATPSKSVNNAPDPLTAALAKAKAQSNERLVAECANRDAVFSYGKAKDPITDRSLTFDELREKYESDFPEMTESKKVEWSVSYGKETKVITNPGSDKIYDIKSEIEKSKIFLDGIKKAKSDADKNPECIVKPRIKAQSKGEIIPLSSYKELCLTGEETRNSQKAIILMPSSDGRIYQIRKTPIGSFAAQADNLPEFQTVVPGFQMTLPKIPMQILMLIWDFFSSLSEEYKLEALVHILYDTKRGKYTVRVPKQRLTHVSVDSVTDEEYPEHMIHVMDIHSHNTMPAKFSAIDDEDEKPTRLYAVMGRLDKAFPDIRVRASCGGKFIPVRPTDVFDTKASVLAHPKNWDDQLRLSNHEKCFTTLFHRLTKAPADGGNP